MEKERSVFILDHYDAMQGLPLAMAYVPWQSWQNVSDAARGLEQGSIFEELIFPFEYAGPGCRNTGNCRRGNFQNTTAVNPLAPSCRQNANQAARQARGQMQNQAQCPSRTRHQNHMPECQAPNHQRRGDCSCQEVKKKN